MYWPTTAAQARPWKRWSSYLIFCLINLIRHSKLASSTGPSQHIVLPGRILSGEVQPSSVLAARWRWSSLSQSHSCDGVGRDGVPISAVSKATGVGDRERAECVCVFLWMCVTGRGSSKCCSLIFVHKQTMTMQNSDLQGDTFNVKRHQGHPFLLYEKTQTKWESSL